MKRITHINVFRQCLDCGYEQFEIEEVKIDENNRRTSSGFIVCPKCNGRHFALVGYRDRRKAHKDMNLPVVFGKTSNGEEVIRDLSRLPHLLIGGLTGFGKSVFLNSLICSLVQNNPPEHLRFVLMDPKGVEFGAYAKLPHLYSPVVDIPEQCMTMLRYVEAEVERRLAMFGEKDVRDISDFRQHLIVVVDEFSDYILELDDTFVSMLSRIAAIGGSVGVHLVLSTSRLDAKNVTDELKANIASRLAFRVCRNVDSLTLIDESGAEDLLMRGDALFKDGDSEALRLQVPYIRDETVKQIVDSAIEQYPEREVMVRHSL
jgi:S-DNA-T family DNA segregation ATPase FtsK/SpoIIIE